MKQNQKFGTTSFSKGWSTSPEKNELIFQAKFIHR
ncbi:unnamed protein product, partial [Vitis vinifera]|uniref:Uncharacterized protein n=1 Tax=Vitis vinifera TaxID=29760 RepID=D7SVT2_VITVI